MVEKYLRNQAKIGLSGPWIILGLAIFMATIKYSHPSITMLSFCLFFSLVLNLTMIPMIAISDKYKYILYFVLCVGYMLSRKMVAKSDAEIVQLASVTVVFFSTFAVMTLRIFRFISVKINYPEHADQSLLRTMLYPDYGRGYTLDSRARDAIEKILRIRKRHTNAADLFVELLNRVEEHKKSDRVTVRVLRDMVTNSNLKISEKQFNQLFR